MKKTKNRTTEILCKLCVTFTDLSGTEEDELECEKLTTETSMSKINNGTGTN